MASQPEIVMNESAIETVALEGVADMPVLPDCPFTCYQNKLVLMSLNCTLTCGGLTEFVDFALVL